MIKAIGDGQNTSLWFDPWVKEGALADIIGRHISEVMLHPSWTVSKIIQNEEWHCAGIPSLVPIWHSIMQTKLGPHKQDCWEWLSTAERGCSLKQHGRQGGKLGKTMNSQNLSGLPLIILKWTFVY